MQNIKLLKDKKIILALTSSIAVYKSADLASKLVKSGADVHVVMTENAKKLISPRIFQTLTRNKVCSQMWEEVEDWQPEHISLADLADLLLVAPATANTIGNFANGLAPDLLSSIFLATTAKCLIAPAMNVKMYEHKIVQANIAKLESIGVEFIEPAEGMLACGYEGKGKLASVDTIFEKVLESFR